MSKKIMSLGFIAVTGFALLVFATPATPTTTFPVWVSPTPKQVKTAVSVLNEALKAHEQNKLSVYENKIQRAQTFLERRQVGQTFEAQIFSDGDNVFTVGEDGELHEQVTEAFDLCYKGSRNEALRLLEEAVRQKYLNWDEEWFENPRVEPTGLVIDWVDGPNEVREKVEVTRCTR